MFPFYQYPYMDYNAFNLDYLTKSMKEQGIDFKAFVSANVLKYHDPIAWDITTQYEPNTIVSNGTDVYLSKQPVRAGIAITNTDYWFKVGDLSTYQLQLDIIRHQIAADDEGTNVNASKTYAAGAVFWLNGYLSEATQTIAAGAPFVQGNNYIRTNVIDLLDDFEAGVNSTLDNMQETINDTVAITRPGRKRVICIGDSLSQGYNPDGPNVTAWPEFLRQLLGLSGSNYYFAGRGQAGFSVAGLGANFLQLLQSLVVTDPETITDIYVIGGANDSNSSSSSTQIRTATEDFCTYCNTAFPNAVVHIGCIAYFTDLHNDAQRLKITHDAIRNGCKYKAHMIPGIIGAMLGIEDYFDGVHVNAACQERIAHAAVNEAGPVRMIIGAGVSAGIINNVPFPNAYVNGDQLHYWKGSTSFCTVQSGQTLKCDGTAMNIGTFTTGGIHGLAYNQSYGADLHSIPVSVQVQRASDNAYYSGYGELLILNKILYLRVWCAVGSAGWLTGAKSINIGPATGSLPII